MHFLMFILLFFSNALLTNAKLTGASISATEVTVPGKFFFVLLQTVYLASLLQ